VITILAWLWRQPKSRTNYPAEHVNIWASMVRRNLSMPHRIACVTDMPEGIDPRVEIITPPGDFLNISSPHWANGKPQCFRRLSMFRPDAAGIFGERFVCMDLDCVVSGRLDPLFDRNDDLVLYKGTASSRPYNGSLMLIRAGCRPHVFEDFNQQAALEASKQFCGSDQAWLAHRLGWSEATWDERDGVHFVSSMSTRKRMSSPRVVFFPGRLKPWMIATVDRFVGRHYRMDEKEAA